MTPKVILSLKVPYTLAREISKVLLLTSIGTALTALPGWAVVVAPTSITVSIPGTAGGADESTNTQADGSTVTYTGPGGTSGAGAALASNPAQSATTAFVDDVILQSVTFGGTTLSNLIPSLSSNRGSGALVTTGRNLVSATYGDTDSNTDANANPYVKSGSGATAYNATINQTPAVQDTAIQAAYNSLSLSEGTSSPGQGGTAGAVDYTFRLLFQNGIVDDSSAVDNVPELVIFERGVVGSTQSDYTVQALIGGTLANPIFAPTTVTVLRANQTPSGIVINTVDSGTAEQINVAGIDINEFGITDPNQAIYGISFTSINGSGADIFGLGLTAASSTQLRDQAAVPEPSTILGSAIGGLFMSLLALKQQAKKRQLKIM